LEVCPSIPTGRHKFAGQAPRIMAATVLFFAWTVGWSPGGVAKEKKPPTRTVSGVVQDEQDNGIEGATIELTDVQTGKVLDIYSQEGGRYQFADLSPMHDYKIKATFKGSSSEERQASSFDPRTRLVINLTIPGPKH